MRAKSTRLRLAAWITLGVSIAASLVELGREARSDEPGDCRQQMEKQDSQIAHAPHRNKPPESLEILMNLGPIRL